VIDAPLALAFTAGMVATVNPCGFAMLPAYLSYFLGIERTGDDQAEAGVLRALVVGAVVSLGFAALFGVAGAIISWTSISIERYASWVTIVIGLVLVVLGARFLRGWEPRLAVPRLDKGGRDRSLWSMFVFGLSYAIASLSCTIGPFMTAVAGTFRHSNFVSGVAVFGAYGLGMAVLLMALTLTLALARHSLLRGLRASLPYIQRVSGGIMVITGAYLTWYGIYEIRVQRGSLGTSGPVDAVFSWSGDRSWNYPDRLGPRSAGCSRRADRTRPDEAPRDSRPLKPGPGTVPRWISASSPSRNKARPTTTCWRLRAPPKNSGSMRSSARTIT
jgi:cytochrome c-type biogenesis protein